MRRKIEATPQQGAGRSTSAEGVASQAAPGPRGPQADRNIGSPAAARRRTRAVPRRSAGIALSTACCLVLLSMMCLGSYRADRERLGAVARAVTAGKASLSDRVLALLDWVYHNHGFASNERYFLFKRLGATPVQVLEGGGDCADKSRLLSALLREVGIPSTMVMCFDVRSGRPTHTVVEARIGPGGYMLVDPVYDLWFPRRDSTGFFGLTDLRRDATILPRRLDELIAARPRSPIFAYNRAANVYDEASSINWRKNRSTRLVHDLLFLIRGEEVYRLRRPIVLEEPKLAVAWGLAALGVASVLVPELVARAWRAVLTIKRAVPLQKDVHVSQAAGSAGLIRTGR